MARRTERPLGFSLLEAVVALAILATAGLALFAAVSQSLQMLERAETARAQDVAVRNALAVLEQVNPMEQPAGSERLGAMVLRWSSTPVEPVRDSTTGYLQPGLHEMGLYDMRVEVTAGDLPVRSFVLRRAGYRQVREPAAL